MPLYSLTHTNGIPIVFSCKNSITMSKFLIAEKAGYIRPVFSGAYDVVFLHNDSIFDYGLSKSQRCRVKAVSLRERRPFLGQWGGGRANQAEVRW